MEESDKKEELEQNIQDEEIPNTKKTWVQVTRPIIKQYERHVLANPNRSIGKGMNATHQTKRPHKPRKSR